MIGLVGGIAAGKSRVAAIFAERGAQVLDADAIGHVLLNQAPAREQVVARFTEDVLDRSGSPDEPPRIDRKILGAIVFADESARKALEAILHPRMRQTFEKAISRAARKHASPAVVIDAAVLFEAKWNELCDVVIFVDAPADVRLARVEASRGWSAETMAAREAVQMPLDAKKKKCDFVVDNSKDEAALVEVVGPLLETLTRKPRTESMRTRRPAPRRPETS